MLKSGNFLALLFCIVMPLCLQSQNTHKISAKLQAELAQRSNSVHEVVIMLEQQVDLEFLLDSFRMHQVNVRERAVIVNKRLRHLAAQSQPEVLNLLQSRNTRNTRSYWIINGLRTDADASDIEAIAALEQVRFIDVLPKPALLPEPSPAVVSAERSGSREKGLDAIKASFMWNLGYTGYGRKALIIDTGADPKHVSLKRNFAGNYYPQSQSWYDPFGSDAPKDCQTHGTHVTGTVVGIDRTLNDTIGVAFDALWMGADIFCINDDIFSVFQWSMDPDDNPNTTEDMPDAINNSWGYPDPSDYFCQDFYAQIYLATEAAGIAVIFAAGNEGPGEKTVIAPAVVVQSLVNVFSVGAVNGNISSLSLAGFSSMGPTYCPDFEGSLAIKPEVSAPGVNVRSAYPGGGYRESSGTSMASPHTTGALILLKSAFPYLSGEELKYALYYSARDLGIPGEDNQYGMGMIDLEAAYNYLVYQGHEPVPAKEPYDIRIDRSTADVDPCIHEVKLTVDVSNNGTLEVTEFVLSLRDEDGQILGSKEVQQTLAPGDQHTETFILTDMPDNFKQIVTVDVQLVHDAETRLLNNYEKMELIHMSLDPRKIIVTDEMPEQICKDTRFLLPVQVDGSELLWYGSAEGSDLLGIGGKPLNFENQEPGPVTIYADWQQHNTLGPGDPGLHAGYSDLFKGGGIKFELFQPARLNSVDCYAEASGIRIFYLLDENGRSLKEIHKRLDPGKNTVTINTDLAPGIYTIEHKFGKNLLMEPFALIGEEDLRLKGVGRIISGIADSEIPGFYGFFYNLDLLMQSPCARVPFTFEIKAKESNLQAAFEVTQEERQMIHLMDASIDAISYLWNFGDGIQSTVASPAHEYDMAGEYEVVLEVEDEFGCKDFHTQNVEIEEATTGISDGLAFENTLSVYPNPAENEIHILSGLSYEGSQKWNIINSNGKVILSGNWNDRQVVHKISVDNLTQGLYIFQVIQNDTVFQRARFIKM